MHARVLKFGESMGTKFLLLNYDQLCIDPANEIAKMLEFLDMDVSEEQRNDLLQTVNPPQSIGRFKQYGLEIFDPEDVKFVSKLGFDTNIEV